MQNPCLVSNLLKGGVFILDSYIPVCSNAIQTKIFIEIALNEECLIGKLIPFTGDLWLLFTTKSQA